MNQVGVSNQGMNLCNKQGSNDMFIVILIIFVIMVVCGSHHLRTMK